HVDVPDAQKRLQRRSYSLHRQLPATSTVRSSLSTAGTFCRNGNEACLMARSIDRPVRAKLDLAGRAKFARLIQASCLRSSRASASGGNAAAFDRALAFPGERSPEERKQRGSRPWRNLSDTGRPLREWRRAEAYLGNRK